MGGTAESNATTLDYTPASCTTSPTDDDDDDNSSILGVLVIALLALVFWEKILKFENFYYKI